MKIKNKRGFAAGILTTILACASLIIYLAIKEQRYLITTLLLAALTTAITLTTILVFMFLTYLCINIYLEKNE